jgi:hypothetical protein
MSSTLLNVVVWGGLFAVSVLLIAFLLWASRRSPRVKLMGAMVAALFYTALASAQLWNEQEAHRATFWKIALAVTLLSAGYTAYRIFKTFGRSDDRVDPPGATRP